VSDETTADIPAVLEAWSQALPRVLALLGEQKRGPFRQELQRYLAATRFQPNDVREHTQTLKTLLVEAARAAAQPAAISLTRELSETAAVARVCEHLLACWRDAEEQSGQGATCNPADGMSGEFFFGPRLGGQGRPGALQPNVAKAGEDPAD